MGTMGKQLTEAWSVAKALGVEDKVEGPLFEAVLKHRSVKTKMTSKPYSFRQGWMPVNLMPPETALW